MSKPRKKSLARAIRAATLLSLLASAPATWAYEFYAQGDTQLSADLEAAFGVFHSAESYAQSGTLEACSASWQEAYFKYGLSGSQGLSAAGDQLYGKFKWVKSS